MEQKLRIQKRNLDDLFVSNLIVPTFFVGLLLTWLLPFDIEHGYKINWDMIMFLARERETPHALAVG